jgi:hypothetical protein
MEVILLEVKKGGSSGYGTTLLALLTTPLKISSLGSIKDLL